MNYYVNISINLSELRNICKSHNVDISLTLFTFKMSILLYV